MSIEQLLFFLFLVAIPLLEWLVRAMRGRTSGSSADDLRARNGGTVSDPRAPGSIPDTGRSASESRGAELPLPASPLPPAVPKANLPAPSEHLRESEREPRRRQRKHVPATSRGRDQSEEPLARLAPGDLRRAIVLAAILGPCRALEPKDTSQRG